MRYERVEIYAVNVWRAVDVFLNAATWGDRGQTISGRVGEKARRGRLWARALDRLFLGHFSTTVEESRGKQIYVSSLAVFFGGVAILVAGYAALHWPGVTMIGLILYLGAMFAVVVGALIRRGGKLP